MLDKKLQEYAKTNTYPFHMPGHKRRMQMEIDPYAIDITEIDGFDNLHHAEDILKEAQSRAAELYGSKKAYYLVNGSTCGLLAAICASVSRRGEMIVARNCHKAVYHGIYLQELTPHYLYPGITQDGISCAIVPEAVAHALEKYPKAQAVLITSPTYDGIVSDIAQIADIVHKSGRILIVDEAHGAHFGITDTRIFPDTAVHCGADIVIQSLHKTLPSFTQTALLHICSSRVDPARLETCLDIFETSSPSYVLMAGMERCIRLTAEEGDLRLRALSDRIHGFHEKLQKLSRLRLLTKTVFSTEQAFDFDESRILIYTGEAGITGKELYDRLLHKYELQMEMATGNYILAMTSFMDSKEGFDRFAEALLAIDKELTENKNCKTQVMKFMEIYTPKQSLCTIAQAVDGKKEALRLCDAKDRAVADYLYLYPPGIPLLAPGEIITQKVIDDILLCQSAGLTIHGLLPENWIKVVN